MIKINKDIALTAIPASIKYPNTINFPVGPIGVIARHTEKKRIKLRTAGQYIDSDEYNSRYKKEDVKNALALLYKNKCAFCEQKIEQFHVEHYRPKNTYYWLAFSWDNLLCACPDCNEAKSTHFYLEGTAETIKTTQIYYENINTLSAQLDSLELPFLVNPEVTDPSEKFDFYINGEISSDDPRFSYTIAVCKLDREYLNDERKKIYDTLKSDLQAIFLLSKTKEDQTMLIKSAFAKFKRDYSDKDNAFLAFRAYVIERWFRVLVKSIFS